ncbi:hypothetical protein [Aquimarina algicola]|uniref:Uncharacterized protein n=1 Tax=Aquimarina algicola TaxID=2589995 RepID=A0A504JCF3_9FLAO|nr:hypothetical protein [Aquimarina algicola]TPN85263.1 hypothetical protein FHK87_14660 [Aquimarina algicola]
MRFLVFWATLCIAFHINAQSSDYVSPNKYRFKYKSQKFKGTRLDITAQLRAIKNQPKFAGIPEEIQIQLNNLFKKAKEQPIPKVYKKNAIRFLDALYSYEEFVEIYDNALYQVVKKLKRDMRRIDFKFEREFTQAKVLLSRTQKEEPDQIQKIDTLKKEVYNNQMKLLSHRWMKDKFDKYKSYEIIENPDSLILEFKKKEAVNVFRMFEENQINKIERYLEDQIIDFYYKKSVPELDIKDLELDYLDKI